MNAPVSDKRKLSGHRVLAECEVTVKKVDPFSKYNPDKKGYIVLNVRGGSLYLPEHFTGKSIKKIFPDGEHSEFIKLRLFANDKPEIIIENIKIVFLRLIQCQNREGIVFSFAETTEQQMDILDSLKFHLPAIGPDEESSVPFDEIMALDRGPDFKFQD